MRKIIAGLMAVILVFSYSQSAYAGQNSIDEREYDSRNMTFINQNRQGLERRCRFCVFEVICAICVLQPYSSSAMITESRARRVSITAWRLSLFSGMLTESPM